MEKILEWSGNSYLKSLGGGIDGEDMERVEYCLRVEST
jgi:hypothetical protein